MTHNFTFFYNSSHPFSNWYLTPFVHDGIQFNCSEQYMMFMKAWLFQDYEVAELIMEETNPRNHKFLGRQVRGYIDEVWLNECQDIMVKGLISKFTQDEYSLTKLLDTGDTIIVEASPSDKLWGIGLAETDPRALDQATWLGKNYLGIVLMKVRDAIRQL